MDDVDTKQHFWVELNYVPVTIEEQPDGSLNVYASEEGLEVAKAEAIYGCWFCNAPLSVEMFHTECQPSNTETRLK